MINQKGETMIRNNSKTAMPDKLLRQVQQVQRSSQSRDRRYAWLIAACVLVTMMIVAMIVESQLNLFSHTLRFALTTVTLVATVTCGWLFWQRGKRQNERLLSAAEQVDSTLPAMEERVATLTSCEEERLKSKLTAHPALLNRLAVEASQIHENVESKPVVSQKVLKRPLTWLATAGLVLLALFVWDSQKTMVQLGRFWAPWSQLSVTNVSSVERSKVVARHEPIKLNAALAGRAVEELQFVSRSVEDETLSETRIWPSSKDPTVATYRQPKAVQSFDYRFRAGDGQTQWHRVTVADRPKIDSLSMRIVPPAYTGRKAKTFKKLPKKLRVLQGSQLEIEVKPRTDVRTARLVMGKTNWLPMELEASGAYEGSMGLHQSANFEVQLTELHGLVNRRPPHCRLQVVSDQAPKVRIVRPTKSTVLLPDETIDIHFKASDDFAIKEMALRVYTQREGEAQATIHEVPIPLDDQKNPRKIEGSVALDLDQFDLKDGDTIRYEVRASDNFIPLQSEQNIEAQPMKGVQLTQNDNEAPDSADQTPPELANGAANAESESTDSAKPDLPEATDPNAQVAGTQSSDNSQDPNTSDSANSNPSMENAQANASANAAAVKEGHPAGQAPQPQSAQGKSAQQNQVAANSQSSDGLNQNSQSAGSKDSQGDSAGSPSEAKKGEQPPADRLAGNPNQPNEATKDNRIVAQQEPNESDPDGTSEAGSNQPASGSAQANSDQQGASQQANKSPSNSNNQSDSSPSESSQVAAKDTEKPNAEDSDAAEQKDSDPAKSDPVQMATRRLDVGQSASSGQQQIIVDQYAGGFTSEHRNKLEIAIAPVLELLKASLESAGKNVRRVMNPTTADPVTGAIAVNVLQDAGSVLQKASEAVIGLNQKTKNTPYAFVGLRLESIRTADVSPAWEDVRKAIEVDGESRLNHTSSAWNHISRALATLKKLEEEYEQVKRDLKRADDIQRFKKMHQVFIENSLAMLNPQNPSGGGPSRKSVEFDLDEEYLKRLKEVLQMREEMMAELARILADDPQLLRRFMNRMNSRNSTIRSQLSLIAEEQRTLAQRVNAWSDAVKNPQDMAEHMFNETEEHLAGIQEVANRLADVQDTFVSWLPLEDDAEKGDAAYTMENFKAAGRNLTEMVADVDAILIASGLSPDYRRRVKPVLEKATVADKQLADVAQSLQRLSNDQTNVEIANNAVRRLPDLQKIRFDTQQWAGKLELLIDDQVNEVYSVNQENRRDQLLEYSVKIASLDSQLVAALPDDYGELPKDVATKTNELQKLVDVEIPAEQLIAAQTLSDGTADLSKAGQSQIREKFATAEQLFDEVLQAVADELDKLPAQDPIASLLEDPTLDEILFQLENELDLLEDLGLGRRPSNLQIIGDWSRSMRQQLMGQQSRMRNLSNRAWRNALARARARNQGNRKYKIAKDDERWNLLVGKLAEDVLQGDKKIPPEHLRSAIEQYHERISKLNNEQE